MDEREISRNNADLIYLVACALHNTAPEEAVVAEMDFDALYRLAQKHSLAAMACMGLENGNAFRHCGAELFHKWKEAKEKAIRKNLLLESEWQKLRLELEREKIWYMPLKGAVLKNLYPRLGMRQMGDYDILFDADKAKEVKSIFENQGYQCAEYGKGIHDEYIKPPVAKMEMHRTLIPASRFQAWAEKYKNVKSCLLAEPGTEYGFHFSDEDFYVYITAHAYKHFSRDGTGLRTLVDFYVYNWKKGAALNWDCVHAELEALGIADYEQSSRQLAERLFCAPNPNVLQELAEGDKALFGYYSGSGAYGTMTNKIKNGVTKIRNDGNGTWKQAKRKYIFFRLFPDRKWYKYKHPFLYRNPWLIPFFTIYRITTKIFSDKRKELLQELRMILSLER